MKRSVIVSVGHVNGGVGKTKLAVNLAMRQAFRENAALLVNGDEQGTVRAFTQFADILSAPGYTAVSLRGSEMHESIHTEIL